MSMIVTPNPRWRDPWIWWWWPAHRQIEPGGTTGRNSSCCLHNFVNAPCAEIEVPRFPDSLLLYLPGFWKLFHLFPKHLTCWLLNCLHILGDLPTFNFFLGPSFFFLFHCYLKCNLSLVVTLWQHPHSFPSSKKPKTTIQFHILPQFFHPKTQHFPVVSCVVLWSFPRFETFRQVKCPVPCSEVTLTSGTEVGDLSTKAPWPKRDRRWQHRFCRLM